MHGTFGRRTSIRSLVLQLVCMPDELDTPFLPAFTTRTRICISGQCSLGATCVVRQGGGWSAGRDLSAKTSNKGIGRYCSVAVVQEPRACRHERMEHLGCNAVAAVRVGAGSPPDKAAVHAAAGTPGPDAAEEANQTQRSNHCGSTTGRRDATTVALRWQPTAVGKEAGPAQRSAEEPRAVLQRVHAG